MPGDGERIVSQLLPNSNKDWLACFLCKRQVLNKLADRIKSRMLCFTTKNIGNRWEWGCGRNRSHPKILLLWFCLRGEKRQTVLHLSTTVVLSLWEALISIHWKLRLRSNLRTHSYTSKNSQCLSNEQRLYAFHFPTRNFNPLLWC